ncbi:phosphatidate cytidylyltransferase [Ruminococcus sp. YE282]|jgi:phosphatidate cytidylyltransferase|uniref:phosphatidate cytidylyltransferase n=1 Tax=Ruminococcus sp. YE282 TaxID=3158780 RepID=UPI0014311EBE|nr:phosphatidate cytidylyltransferase [Ruminococcus bromii]MDY4711364.1 phosphatidate cytidylyltransferase [Ruminococcus bromii]MEE0964518.1 phosphatidate cytidylyltransferase [Ruminococcus bromii]MEE3499155.1 phosphatidate cytidylyltransferase [Ruminococcus bromii]
MKSLKPRLLTAVVGISAMLIIMFASVYLSPIIGIMVIGACSAFMTGEYLHAKNLLKSYPLSIPCMAFAFVLPLVIMTQYLHLILYAVMIIGFFVIIMSHKKLTYHDLSYSLFGTLLISFGMSSIAVMCNDKRTVIFYFILAFLLPWMADAGGFFIGAAFGTHKLCPNISPKKTIEGAIGGVIFCILSAVLMGLVFQYIIMPDVTINLWALALLGFIDAPLSILGDLSFSLIKRSLNIKDYGSIFPGHGGMLDRCDSIIFTAPAIILVGQFIPFITLG